MSYSIGKSDLVVLSKEKIEIEIGLIVYWYGFSFVTQFVQVVEKGA